MMKMAEVVVGVVVVEFLMKLEVVEEAEFLKNLIEMVEVVLLSFHMIIPEIYKHHFLYSSRLINFDCYYSARD